MTTTDFGRFDPADTDDAKWNAAISPHDPGFEESTQQPQTISCFHGLSQIWSHSVEPSGLLAADQTMAIQRHSVGYQPQ